MTKRLVSVVIPCLNARATLEAAVASARDQSGVAVEVICVNDGSRDDSHTLLSALAARGAIDYIDTGVTLGASAARNLGFKAAQGEFIQFLDADDTLLADKLRRQVELLRVYAADFVAGAYAFTNLGGHCSLSYPDKDCWAGLIASKLGRTSSNLFRARALNLVGGWASGQKSSQEYELMFRLLQSGARVACDDIVGTCINAVSSSISNRDLQGNAARFSELREKMLTYLRSRGELTDYRRRQYERVCQPSRTVAG
ncbi:MAG: glycosyltransferase family 2 protein [Exilibacterium sp.]